MTYKLNPIIAVITSPVRLLFPDGDSTEYESGKAVSEAVFDQNYRISEIRADNGVIEIIVGVAGMPITTWIGEEQSFF